MKSTLSFHKPRKRLGQHFLRDKNVIAQIVAAIAPKPGDLMVEIGAGFGALTEDLLSLVGRLDVVELDRDLIPHLITRCEPYGELMVHQANALHFDYAALTTANNRLRLVGNLPYNISTPLMFHLLTFTTKIRDMVFMLQKEVAERIVAKPGDEAYGRLSVMIQYHCTATLLFLVGPAAFTPPPKVDSAIIRLVPYDQLPYPVDDFALFTTIVREAFNHRRKTLRNSLKELISAEQLQRIGIDPVLRAERLSVADFVKIANYCASQK